MAPNTIAEMRAEMRTEMRRGAVERRAEERVSAARARTTAVSTSRSVV